MNMSNDNKPDQSTDADDDWASALAAQTAASQPAPAPQPATASKVFQPLSGQPTEPVKHLDFLLTPHALQGKS